MNSVDTNQNNIEEKKQKTKLKKSILVLIIVIIMGLIGVTIANQVEKTSRASVTTGNYNVIINGNTTVSPLGLIPITNTSDTISPSNLSNYSDSIFVSEFTVKGADGNPVDQDIIYDIALINSDIDTNLLNTYLKWELIKNNEIIANGNFSDLTNGKRYVLTNIQQDLPANNEAADSLKLVMWINNDFPEEFDQTTMMNKSFNATIDVELYTKSKIGYNNLYLDIAKSAVMDNVRSEYVESDSGVNFASMSSDTNGKGIYIRAGTENNTYPIYYYRGAVDNNNVLFANFCWKIVRTTDTGGIKMIYNGTPDNNKCTNQTGASTRIGTTAISPNSPDQTGYMYGNSYTVKGDSGEGWYYGNDVSWDGSKYTLVADSTNIYLPAIKNTTSGNNLNFYHYTCGSSTDISCTSVRYVFYYYSISNTKKIYYITLSNGKKVEDALEEMLSSKSDSAVKTIVDNWYKNNMTSYTNNYIEDAIYCNDRTISNYAGWNPNGGNITSSLKFGYTERASNPIVTCQRKIDKFTTSRTTGNGKLTYPVGLLTVDEVRLAGASTVSTEQNKTFYLYTNDYYYLGTPYSYSYYGRWETLTKYGYINGSVAGTFDIRPVISLKPDIKLSSGDGTANNPYTVE